MRELIDIASEQILTKLADNYLGPITLHVSSDGFITMSPGWGCYAIVSGGKGNFFDRESVSFVFSNEEDEVKQVFEEFKKTDFSAEITPLSNIYELPRHRATERLVASAISGNSHWDYPALQKLQNRVDVLAFCQGDGQTIGVECRAENRVTRIFQTFLCKQGVPQNILVDDYDGPDFLVFTDHGIIRIVEAEHNRRHHLEIVSNCTRDDLGSVRLTDRSTKIRILC